MRLMQLLVRTVMYGTGNEACGRGRSGNFTVSGKRGVHLDARFKIDLTIQVERDVPAGSLDLLRAKHAPHETASSWYDLGKLRLTCPTAYHRKRATDDDLFKLNVVFHAIHLQMGSNHDNCWTPSGNRGGVPK